MIVVERYRADMAAEWNRFVAQSKQGIFLVDRRYMDYHADRFADYSLVVHRNGKLFALLPANAVGDKLYSHQGLTYGGLVTGRQATAETVCEAFIAINDHLRQAGFHHVFYKPVPHIYHRQPAEEDLYALFMRCNARLVERDVASTLRLDCPPRFEESRRSGLRKATRLGLTVAESTDVEAFWQILVDNLHRKYDAKPVHTAAEMRLLMSHFSEQIRLLMVYNAEQVPVGGTVLYLTPQTIHTQYISASQEGKQTGALDLLFDRIINQTKHTQTYFDFGTSAEADSCEVNASLIFQKLGFGGRAVCYDRYAYDL